VGDFNRDGRLDLVCVKYAVGANDAVSVMLQAPTVTLSSSLISYGDHLLQTGTTESVTLTNTSPLTLKIASMALVGANTSDFSQTHTCLSTLAPGASCTIDVTFKPSLIGSRAAAIEIRDNGVGSPHTIALRGTGVVSGPNATLRPNLTFQPQITGTVSSSQTAHLSNYGTSTLNISVIKTTGDFSQTHTCGSTLAPGAQCAITVTFKPTAAGTRLGTLSVGDNAPGSAQAISLNGTGAVATTASLTPSSMTFSCVARLVDGGCTPPQNATLKNTGTSTLYILGVDIIGKYFAAKNSCPLSLSPGASCVMSVSFDGPASRSHPQKQTWYGILIVYDTTNAGKDTVTLTGYTSGVP
jgi:hypothetical protein